MKHIFIILCISVTMLSAQGQQMPKWKIADVENYIAASKDEVLVINLWATFCKPCVAEIPSFIKIANQYKSEKVKLVLVSLDLPSFYPGKIASFAKKHHFNTNIVWLEETDADYFGPKIDKSWSGSIPATLMINTKTGYRKFYEEELEPEVFEKEILKAIAG